MSPCSASESAEPGGPSLPFEPGPDVKLEDHRRALSARSLFVLASPFLAAQIVFVIQQAFGVPYLLSIGFSNSEVTLALLAGPIAGFFLPPVIAATSDGARRRLIVGGGLAVLVALLCLAWAPAIGTLALAALGRDSSSPPAIETAGKCVAVVAIYALNFSMQPLHLGLRALLMDVCPPHQQTMASLWITRLSSTGSVVGTATAYFSSPSFRFLSTMCCVALGGLLALHSLEARQHYARMDCRACEVKGSTYRSVARRLLLLAMKSKNLPPVTRRVCRAQLWSWFAWFPVLFYMSSAMTSSHMRTAAEQGRATGIDEEAKVASAGAMLVFHCVVLSTTTVLQVFVKKPSPPSAPVDGGESTPLLDDGYFEAYEQQLFQVWSFALSTAAVSSMVVPILGRIDNAVPLILTSLGVQFAMCNWVPYGLIALDLAIMSRPAGSEESVSCDADSAGGDDGLDGASSILAIHNCAICIPQIASAIVCAIFFRVAETLGLAPDVSTTFFLVSPALFMAAYDRQTWRRRR